ncbi:MAG TPA: lysylphosphatidylglycerol synthase domain-containing protein [Polyangiaceae bacterium]|nr:lysylphosphatidylglycerol synthase domain-containing protein [Polyangiaceae bacterium]
MSASAFGIADWKRLARRLARIARPLLAILAIVFVVYAARDLAARWESSEVQVDWLLLACSIAPLALSALVLAIGWKWLVERMVGKSLPRTATIALNLESQVARYMPGKVGLVLVRMAGAARIGAPASTVGSSAVIETLSYVAVGGACGFIALAAFASSLFGALAQLGRWGLLVFALFAVATLVVLSLDRRRIPEAILGALGLHGTGALAPLRLPLSHGVYWMLTMLHGYLVTRAVGGSHEAALASSGFYVLAPVVGFLAIVVPGGLGVREAFLSIGLAPSIGPAAALSAALVSRTASVLLDVAGWLLARALSRDSASKSLAGAHEQTPADRPPI